MKRWQWIFIGLIGMAIFTLTQPVARKAIVSAFEKIRGLIAGEEGLRLTAYQDAVGKWTIGYGHLIQPGEPYYPYNVKTTITQAEADALFARDIAAAENCVRNNVTAPLNENQYSALVSFIFNVGCAAFTSSRLLAYLNTRDSRAANEFNRWVYATRAGKKIKLAGLIARRMREKQLFTA